MDRRTVLRTGAKLAYATPVIAVSMAFVLEPHPAPVLCSAPGCPTCFQLATDCITCLPIPDCVAD